ncbi:hypothetical protein VNI00_017529 [Paramarasmius palmivorus]|uniref:Ribonuclease H1 N-terminal domain-containing protein n=1 Tax=Paramarasmius palmivorus TaxID=297713 RepID=A0AAW0B602_9AGAR
MSSQNPTTTSSPAAATQTTQTAPVAPGSLTREIVLNLPGWRITTTITTTVESLVPGTTQNVGTVIPLNLPTTAAIDNANNAAPSGAPHPDTLTPRPGTELHTKFYVVFRGLQVGIFYDWHTEAQQQVLGVPHNCYHLYPSWHQAHHAYTEAYNGRLPGRQVRVIQPPEPMSIDLDSEEESDGEESGQDGGMDDPVRGAEGSEEDNHSM